MEIDSPSGVVGLWDKGAFTSPLDPANREFVPALRERSTEGSLFFVDAEDHVTYRVDLLVESELPSSLAKAFNARSGSFRLRAPTGEIRLGPLPSSASETSVTVPPGEYVVTPYARQEFDPSKYDQEIGQLVGETEWRYHKKVDALGSAGCLAWLVLAIVLAIPTTRSLWPITLPTLLLPWFVYFALTKLPRYRAAERKQSHFERSLPHFVITLRRSAVANEIPGGWSPGL